MGVTIYWSWSAFLVLCVLFLNLMELEGSISFEDNIKTESDDVISLMKDELQNLRKDLTKSFMVEHTRRKRSALGFIYEASISQMGPDLEIRVDSDSTGHSSCTFNGEILVFQKNGIHKVDRSSSNAQLVRVNEWTLGHGDTILNTHEWDEILFILTSNKNGSYSRLYTLQASDYIPIPRQQIRNQGFASAAQFFQHFRHLYMIIAVDNAARSLTISPIYRWFQTYMDQMHEIQTRGASAVETFRVNSIRYIAIAQSQDAAGNYEVGTILVRMFQSGDVEELQLLWSNDPVALSHVRILQEDYLVIGQRRESCIVYWFAGYDLMYWQSLDGCSGKKLFIDTLVLPDEEPLLLAANENSVKFYSRISSTKSGSSSDLVLNLTSIAYSTASTEEILNAHFLQVTPGKYLLSLTVNQKSSLTSELKVFSIQFNKKNIVEIVPEGKLSICLTDLKNHLDHDEPTLKKLEKFNDLIITKNEDLIYSGSIVVSQNAIILSSRNTTVNLATIQPDITLTEEKYTIPPSQILSLANKQISDFDIHVKPRLDKVLLKSVPGNITGGKTFINSLEINNLQSICKLELVTFNEVPWPDFEKQMLKTHSELHQTISGDWTIRKLKTEKFDGGDFIGNISIDDFLVTNCGIGGRQIVHGRYIFNEDLHFNKGLALGPSANINGILFSDIILRSRQPLTEVRGYKHADFINGGDGFEALHLNGLNVLEWYNSVLKIDGEEQFSSGLKTFALLKSINNVQVKHLNDHDWDQFIESIILSGPNQTIHGDLNCEKFITLEVHTEAFNGKSVKDLLTTNTKQHITSDISVSDLKLRGNIETGTVNGKNISLSVLTTEDAIIRGPLQLKKFVVSDVLVNDLITISQIDVSEAAKLRKTHIYNTLNKEPLHIGSDFEANKLESISLNGIAFENIRNTFWRTDVQNEIPGNFDMTSAGKVELGEFSTGRLNGLQIEKDLFSINKDDRITLSLQFDSEVYAQDVDFPDGVELNEVDFSEFAKKIILTSVGVDFREIKGHKYFKHAIEATKGIKVGRVNNISLEEDVVYLKGIENQQIFGDKKFENVFAEDVWSGTDISVTGTVNGYNLKVINHTTAYHNRPVKIKGDIISEGDIEASNLHVNNEINGKCFSEILKHSIDLTTPQTLAIPLIISFGTLGFTQDSYVHTINGINPAEYLIKVVNKNLDNNIINGTKEFYNVNIEKNLDNCKAINGIDILDLKHSAFSKTKDQTITGKIRFQEVHSLDNMKTERIGGILLSDLVQTNEISEIASNVYFQGTQTDFDDNIELVGLLNGYKIEEVAQGLKFLHGNRQFHTMFVEGNLSWEKSKVELKRFSHLFQESVTIASDQTLSHKIIFRSDLIADSIQSKEWINGIDLDEMKNDGIFQNQFPILTGVNTFPAGLLVSHGSVQVNKKLDVSFINSISLKALNEQVIRIDSTNQIIKGMKTFENGLCIKNLNVSGNIDTIHPADLVVKGDNRTIDRITMTDAKILNNLYFDKLEGEKLQKILSQRISLHENQTIFGNFDFERDVIVEECLANQINGINESDVFLNHAKYLQHISGQKTFKNLKIDGLIQETSINGIFLDILNSQIYNRNENEVFDRHVIFQDTVLVLDINITKNINTVNFEKIQAEFSTQLMEVVDHVSVSELTRNNALIAIQELKDSLTNQAFWFDDYLVPKQYLGDIGSRSRVEFFISEGETSVVISLHDRVLIGENKKSKCDLPPECLCKSIKFLELDENNLAKEIVTVEGTNIFDLRAPSGSVYVVYSTVISYNQTCTSQNENGITEIWQLNSPEHHPQFIKSKNKNVNHTSAVLLKKIEAGYLSDVKSFSNNGKDYIVQAQYYNTRSKSHNADILIYEIFNGIVKQVQTLNAYGAIRLDLENVDNIWILAVANSLAETSTIEDCGISSRIYQWSKQNEKEEFVLLKEVETVGVVDVVILNVLKFSKFHDSFVIIGENDVDTEESRSLGKISIYNFKRTQDSNTPSYNLFQTLDFKTPISALYKIVVREQAYLFAVINSEILFFKYFHYEGFKKSGSVKIDGALDTNVILWKGGLVFVVASTKTSVIAQAVISGSPEHFKKIKN